MVRSSLNGLLMALVWYVAILGVGIILYASSMLDIRWILTILILVLGTSSLIYAAIKQKGDVLAPTSLLPFVYMWYTVGPLTLSKEFSQDAYVRYLLLNLVGLVSMKTGLWLGTGKCHPYGVLHDDFNQRERDLFLLTIIGMITLSILSLSSHLYVFGGLKGFIETGYGGEYYLALEREFTIGAGWEWWMISIVLLIFYGVVFRSTFAFTCGIMLLIPTLGILLLVGRRRPILYPLFFGFLLLYYRRKKFNPAFIIVALLVGMSILQFVSYLRSFLPMNVMLGIKYLLPIVLKNPVLLAPWNINEFKWPHASLLEILEYGGPGLILGQSYVAAIGAVFPFLGRLFSTVAFDVNKWRLQTFYPKIEAAGGGLAFSPVTEGYMNFGIFGIVLHLLLYGYTIGKIFNRFQRRQTLPNLLLLAGSLPVFALEGIRATSSTFVYAWVRVYLMPWILYWLLHVGQQLWSQKT